MTNDELEAEVQRLDKAWAWWKAAADTERDRALRQGKPT